MQSLVVISGSSRTSRDIHIQLQGHFRQLITIIDCSIDNHSGPLPKGDIYLFSSNEIAKTVQALQGLPPTEATIIGTRCLNPEGIVVLASLPAKSTILLVNDTRDSCSEVTIKLQEAGLADIRWIPWYPGCNSHIKGIEYAITPGETELIPASIPHHIDIGSRILDSYTISMLIKKLQLQDQVNHDLAMENLQSLMKYARSLSLRQQERDAYARELVDTRNYLNGILEAMPSVIIGISKDGIIEHCNQSAIKLFGTTIENIKGGLLRNFSPILYGYLQMALSKTDNEPLEIRLSKLPGFFDHANISLFPLKTDTSHSFVIRVDDQSQQVAQEKIMQRLHKIEMVGQLAASIAHDFNNYMGSITGSLSMLAEICPETEDVMTYIKTMREAASRVINLNRKLLTLSREQPLNLEAIELAGLCQGALDFCKASFEQSVTICTPEISTTATIIGDRFQLEQVLINLIINAYHALLEKSEKSASHQRVLEIELQSGVVRQFDPQRYCQITIRDNGLGISADILPHIFEPFFSTKQKGKGTGLGLSIAYNIVRQHKGYIEIESTPGAGSSFMIQLPERDASVKTKQRSRVAD